MKTTHSDYKGLSSFSSSKYFDAIDKAHDTLEHDRDLAQKVPSCVVVGMQSVGKSAILSRISGICFPQDSEVCTRVATELRLRRARGDQDVLKPMTIKAGNFEAKEVDKTDDDAIENALKEAQKEVLNGRQFEDKLSVKVEKEDVDLPEVTLVDLPGVFFAKDNEADSLEAQVKNMIQERVQNDMALILHVVPLNQDTDTVSTWRTVHDADEEQERTITVLTKVDLAVKDVGGKEKVKKRIQKILKDKSSKCFVVHGAAKSLEDEKLQLSQVSNFIEDLGLGGKIKVGLKELNEFIEERMFEHIKQKIPEMRNLLENELNLSKDELKILGRQPHSPISIALRDSLCMKHHLAEAYQSFQPDYRCLTEEMGQQLFGIDLEPIGLVDADEACEILQRGWQNYSPTKSQFQDHILALEVKKIGEDSRTMINVQYVGNGAELDAWLQPFAEPLEMVLEEYIENVFGDFDRKVLHPSMQKGSSEPTKVLSKELELKIKRNVIFKAKCDAIDYANYLVDSVKKNTFTCNDHYLSETTKELEDRMDRDFLVYLKNDYKLEMRPYINVVCGIRAFFKTRKNMLPDTIQLHFTKALNDLFKVTDKEIGDLMLLETSIARIKESSDSIARRKFLLAREKTIKSALEEIGLL